VPVAQSRGLKVLMGALASLLGGLAMLSYRISSMGAIPADQVPGQLPANMAGPFKVAMTSNQYAPAILTLVAVATIGFLVAAYKRTALAGALPDEKKLDDMAYRVITVAFPFLSFGIIMGAVWAHESWGRYWGWDPKETWALITWFVYAAYLHTRITLGWVGKPGAAIAVAGFAVVLFTYMGVNLGLTGEGLHTYGSG
jgi:cytochrome c-type biogenesis protein CcsB